MCFEVAKLEERLSNLCTFFFLYFPFPLLPSLYENKYWRQGPLSLKEIPFAKKIMSVSYFCFGRVMWDNVQR